MSTKIDIILEDNRVMHAELLPEHAPISVANFIELIKANFFDGLCFHRVIPSFMIQGGGFKYNKDSKLPFSKLTEKKAPKTIKGEFLFNSVANKLKHTKGVLSMARAESMNSASSQFFVCVDECASLDGKYAAFGRLVDDESIDVAVAISRVPTAHVGQHGDVPIDGIFIKTITIVE